MKEEKTYYEKILVSSGEVPENSGLYHTDQGQMRYSTFSKNWQDNELPEYWLKPTPVPSPKQEALDFAEWKDKKEDEGNLIADLDGLWYLRSKTGERWAEKYTLSELYDKFKEKGEK